MMFSLFLFMIVGVFSDLKLTINHQDLFMHFDDNPPQTIGELIEAIKRQIAMDSSFGFNIDDDPTWKFWVPSKQINLFQQHPATTLEEFGLNIVGDEVTQINIVQQTRISSDEAQYQQELINLTAARLYWYEIQLSHQVELEFKFKRIGKRLDSEGVLIHANSFDIRILEPNDTYHHDWILIQQSYHPDIDFSNGCVIIKANLQNDFIIPGTLPLNLRVWNYLYVKFTHDKVVVVFNKHETTFNIGQDGNHGIELYRYNMLQPHTIFLKLNNQDMLIKDLRLLTTTNDTLFKRKLPYPIDESSSEERTQVQLTNRSSCDEIPQPQQGESIHLVIMITLTIFMCILLLICLCCQSLYN
eukprot:196093_1